MLLLACCLPALAQLAPSRYGDAVKADVKVKYVYTLEEALQRSRAEKKPIFFNCFADWALPCHGMNKYVFSNQSFADYLEKHFVPLIMDVTKSENRIIAERYKISTFVHYLVLDENGEVLHRIIGGKNLPAFQNDVALALSPKTSLAGTTKAYQAGKRDLKTLRAYFRALDLSGNDTLSLKIARELLGKIKAKHYAKKENWTLVTKLIRANDSGLLQNLIANKAAYVKENGDSVVNTLLEYHYYGKISDMAGGGDKYDARRLMDFYFEVQRAQLPSTSFIYRLYDIAKLRGEKKYEELVEYFRAHGDVFKSGRVSFELTLDLPDMTEAQKQAVVDYLRERAQVESPGNAKHLNELAQRLAHNEGIVFEHGTFDEAQAKAQKEGKLLFVDVYTTWCGPCKMMARDVFPQAQVGAATNPYYVSIKIDAEKGEGVALAQRYGVTAYPTMLVINADGTLRHSIVGARSPKQLVEELQKARQ